VDGWTVHGCVVCGVVGGLVGESGLVSVWVSGSAWVG
jgi:hypothetical protein